jgi:hypothetical protein
MNHDQRTLVCGWSDVPDGVFVRHENACALVWEGALHPWDAGYGTAVRRPTRGDATVLTPACTVAVIRAGYVPQVGVR